MGRVADTGHLITAQPPQLTPALRHRLTAVHGRPVPAYPPATNGYFRWHRTNTFRG